MVESDKEQKFDVLFWSGIIAVFATGFFIGYAAGFLSSLKNVAFGRKRSININVIFK